MVKLQKTPAGSFILTVPREKVLKLRLKHGDEFDVTYDINGNIVYSKLEVQKDIT